MFSPSNVAQIRWTCNPIETEAGCHATVVCLALSTCCCFLLAINPLTQLCKCCLPQEKLQSPDQQSESGGFWELHMCGGESAGKGQLHWHRTRPKQWVWRRPHGLSVVVPVNTSNRWSENQHVEVNVKEMHSFGVKHQCLLPLNSAHKHGRREIIV